MFFSHILNREEGAMLNFQKETHRWFSIVPSVLLTFLSSMGGAEWFVEKAKAVCICSGHFYCVLLG